MTCQVSEPGATVPLPGPAYARASDASVRSWFPWDDDIEPGDIPHLAVYDTEPEIIATILGPDGHPLAHLTDRATIPVGFEIPHLGHL